MNNPEHPSFDIPDFDFLEDSEGFEVGAIEYTPRNPTCLTYWFPKILEAGLHVPKTTIIYGNEDQLRDLYKIFDCKKPEGPIYEMVSQVLNAAKEIGFPCFLRNSQTSAKHYWKDSCYLTAKSDILSHMASIIEYEELGHWSSTNIWVVREFLPTMPIGYCEGYRGMPICREFRIFVEDDIVKCCHPYWPLEAFEQGRAKTNPGFDYEAFCTLNEQEHNKLYELASLAGKVVKGAWSIDFLETKNGWYLTDMAEAHKSFHWEGCPNHA